MTETSVATASIKRLSEKSPVVSKARKLIVNGPPTIATASPVMPTMALIALSSPTNGK